jgi:hypothetical protein
MTPGTRNDGLRLQLSGVDVNFMRVDSASLLPGVVILAAAARNGPGQGLLIASPAGLTWQAPGSSTPGPIVSVPADGVYMLEDGSDPSQWIRVQCYAAYLPDSGGATIDIGDSYNALGPDDVSAANASAGITETVEFTLKNLTANTIATVKLWLDPATANITVSSDGTNYYDPTSPSDAHVLTWASIAAGASVNLWIKRIIPSSTSYSPSISNLLQWQWNGLN